MRGIVFNISSHCFKKIASMPKLLACTSQGYVRPINNPCQQASVFRKDGSFFENKGNVCLKKRHII